MKKLIILTSILIASTTTSAIAECKTAFVWGCGYKSVHASTNCKSVEVTTQWCDNGDIKTITESYDKRFDLIWENEENGYRSIIINDKLYKNPKSVKCEQKVVDSKRRVVLTK